MGYIQVDEGLIRHRKTLYLSRLLDEDRCTIVGRLVALWSWCLDSAIDGDLSKIEPEIIADVMGYHGDSGQLLDSLVQVGLLDRYECGHLFIHDWFDYRRENLAAHEEWNRLRAVLTPIIFERDGHACVYCGATERLTIDHRIPLSRGGNNSRSNLCTACLGCNQSKYNRTPDEWEGLRS